MLARFPLFTRAPLFALAVVLLAAPPRGATAETPRDSGPDEPVRVATLLPFVADALATIPARATVVASVRRSAVDQAPVRGIDLGSPHAPSFERLAESRAQLVVADAAMHAALQDELARGGATVLLVDTASVDGTFAGLVEVGRRVGGEAEMARAVAAARDGIAAASLAQPIATLPFFGAPGNFLVITERTWLGDLLDELDFRNLARASTGKESFPGYVLVSDEVLAGMQPAIVLVVAHGDPEAIREAFARRAAGGGPWRSLQAARLGVHVLDAGSFGTNPGLAMPETARRLQELVQHATAAR